MLAGISRRLHGLVQDVEAYALRSGVQRVIGYLLRNQAVDDSGGGEAFTVSLPVSKATLASRLSLTPEYFSRVLHELEAAGLISVDKRDIHILDIAGLVALPRALSRHRAPPAGHAPKTIFAVHQARRHWRGAAVDGAGLHRPDAVGDLAIGRRRRSGQ